MDEFASWADQDEIKAPVPQEIRNEDIVLALRNVPVRFREVVLMADVEQFSHKNSAWILKIPLGKVVSRLSWGRELLRQELAGICENCTESAQAANESRKVNSYERSEFRLQALRAGAQASPRLAQ